MELITVSLLVFAGASFASPVSQPVYPNTQYVSAQAIPAVQYSRQQPQAYLQQQQQQQPQYISGGAVAVQTARPVYETDRSPGLQKYSTQIKQPIQQVLLSTNVDRQIYKTAQGGGPYYAQQVQAAQQQAQAQEAIASAQRKATSQTLGRQTLALQQPQQQPQYITASQQPRYSRPVPQTYRPAPQQQQQTQQTQEQEASPEDYDPNPSYQFGFDVSDDQFTNYQNRKEQREGNKITGSYSVVDSDGFVRTVTYTADPKEGFKAEVTRQPTDIVVKIPKPEPQFARQPQQYEQEVPAQQRERGQAQRPNVVYQYE